MGVLNKSYPDSAEGAVSMLKADSTLDTAGASAEADPEFAGVWLVTLKTGKRACVWLAGYGGNAYNDFEVED